MATRQQTTWAIARMRRVLQWWVKLHREDRLFLLGGFCQDQPEEFREALAIHEQYANRKAEERDAE